MAFEKTAFCLILLVWVYFFVPETKGVPIEEMDKLFGGNSGEADLRRIANIRDRLGIDQTDIRQMGASKGLDMGDTMHGEPQGTVGYSKGEGNVVEEHVEKLG